MREIHQNSSVSASFKTIAGDILWPAIALPQSRRGSPIPNAGNFTGATGSCDKRPRAEFAYKSRISILYWCAAPPARGKDQTGLRPIPSLFRVTTAAGRKTSVIVNSSESE